MKSLSPSYPHKPDQEPSSYDFLEENQIRMIDEALRSLGEYGEVRLIVEKGRLRFIVTQKSFDAFKWKPGSMDASSP